MKRLFIFFVVLCCGLHLSAMGGAMEDAIEAQDIKQVESLLQKNPELATTSVLERNNVHCSDMTKNNTLAIAKLLLETQGNKIDLNVYGKGKLTHACAPNLSASYNDKCTLLDQMINDAEYHKKVEKCVPNPEKSTKLVKCYKWEVCEELADLLKSKGAQTYADLHGSGNSSASNQSSSQRQVNNVSSNTQPVTNIETKKEKKEDGTADKNTDADRTITVSGTVVYNNKGIYDVRLFALDANKQQIQQLGIDTDEQGVFTIQNVPSNGFIKVEPLGNEYQEMIVAVKEFNGNINLRLKTKSNLDEVNSEEINHPDGQPCKDFANYIKEGTGKVYNCGNDQCSKCVPSECVPGYELVTVNGEPVCRPEVELPNIPEHQKSSYEDICLNEEHKVDGKCVANEKPEQPKNPECKDGAEWNGQQCVCKHADYIYKDDKCVENENLKEKRKAYDDAKEKQQSVANRTLTAATVAATGIGGMELARGLAEQSADRDAVEDMDKYIQTMRCEYGNGKSVKTIDVKNTEIELPGGNDQNIMNYRAQYLTLAADLKVRKEALGMKPGIESEEILDKATAGLYDDENTGITSGSEASLYRAQMLKSEKDKTKLDEASAASQRRVTGGAIATGVGVVGGALGNQIINGELGEKIKDMFKSKKFGAETQKLMDKEAKALDELKSCLKTAGVKDTDKLTFEKFYASVIHVKTGYEWLVDCTNKRSGYKLFNDNVDVSSLNAQDLFIDTTDANYIYSNMKKYFTDNALTLMINKQHALRASETEKDNGRVSKLKDSLESVKKQFEDADKKDKESAAKQGIDLAKIFTNNGFGNFKDMFSDKDFMALVQNVKK